MRRYQERCKPEVEKLRRLEVKRKLSSVLPSYLLTFLPSASNQGGFILIVILMILAILVPAVIVFSAKTQINVLQAANFRDTVQAVRMARSGVEGAIGILNNDDATYDTLKDTWAMDFPQLSVAGGGLSVKIVDEDSKININKLVPDGISADTYVYARLQSLIKRLGGKPEIVDALKDWMDIDGEVTGTYGAEDEYYKKMNMLPKNGPLDSLDELFMVRGFDKELLVDKGLKYYITVADTDGKINVNTAAIEVLYDISDKLREGIAEEIVRHRMEKEYKSVNDLLNTIGIDTNTQAELSKYMKVNSATFTVTSKFRIGKVVKTVEAVLKRAEKTTSVISWRES
jgi:type II secretory pathway component PulK